MEVSRLLTPNRPDRGPRPTMTHAAGRRSRSASRRGSPTPSRFSGDLLVVGAGRRGRMARIWHGRVSRYCLAHALCPVITVPPPALAQTAGHGLRAWSFRHRELTVDRALPGGPDGEKLGRDHR